MQKDLRALALENQSCFDRKKGAQKELTGTFPTQLSSCKESGSFSALER